MAMEEDNKKAYGVTFTGDITVNGPMFDIHDNEHVHIGRVADLASDKGQNTAETAGAEQDGELFHFVHPEIEGDEAWRIHRAVKRVVASQKVTEICAYLRELRQRGKVLLPSTASSVYKELQRLGMPTGEGFSEKHFSNSYLK